MNRKILLNWFPPSMESMPSPALSVLKTALEKSGFEVNVVYWNLRLNSIIREFFNLNDLIYETEYNKLLPFFSYLAIEHKDLELTERLAYYILQQKPQLHSKGLQFIVAEFERFHTKLNKIIDEYIATVDWSDYLYVGFSSLFYQWIVANIFTQRLKRMNQTIPVVIGGFNTKDESLSFMKNFHNFDYASWGEGEYSLLKLSMYLSGESPFEEVPHTIWRGERLVISKTKNNYQILDNLPFDFSDYITEMSRLSASNNNIALPIEGGRGCHWQRCHFCYLNAGYKSRVKNVEAIISEIESYISHYGISSFIFLDNDIVGKDIGRFDRLLNALIELKEVHHDFSILCAEIITKDLKYEHIKKMAIVNFQAVQIGYESPSNAILRKIDKKNTFASNLFFIKWAFKFNIRINGANVLKNLLEETPEDIKEGIHNLFFQRFFLSHGLFQHSHSTLSVARCSKYFKELQKQNKLEEWQYSTIYSSLPKGFLADEDKYDLILDFVKKDYDSLWDIFEKVEKHYLSNKYDYVLYRSQGTVLYRETYNNLITNEIEFELDSLHWKVLSACNKQILSLSSLKELLYGDSFINTEDFERIIAELLAEGILYKNEDMTELVSIIDTDKIF